MTMREREDVAPTETSQTKKANGERGASAQAMPSDYERSRTTRATSADHTKERIKGSNENRRSANATQEDHTSLFERVSDKLKKQAADAEFVVRARQASEKSELKILLDRCSKVPLDVISDACKAGVELHTDFNAMVARGAEFKQKGWQYGTLDKFYHCHGHCEAVKHGEAGWVVSEAGGLGKEINDFLSKKDGLGLRFKQLKTGEISFAVFESKMSAKLADCYHDMGANLTGRIGALTGVRCAEACSVYRPKRLK
ncbi:hypothetical protein [Bradyrhizobium sp. RT3b]|uniref:hypothetical protein n=1 Tax=Bradyrhizobium sp. RT3b TaxID=3156334 RepID=UPI0033921EBC